MFSFLGTKGTFAAIESAQDFLHDWNASHIVLAVFPRSTADRNRPYGRPCFLHDPPEEAMIAGIGELISPFGYKIQTWGRHSEERCFTAGRAIRFI